MSARLAAKRASRPDSHVPRSDPDRRRKLEAYSQDGNKALLGAVNEQIDRAAAGS